MPNTALQSAAVDNSAHPDLLWLFWLLLSIMAIGGITMKSMTAKEAKNGFGLLLDTARAEPVTVEKHGRPVVVVLSVEEYQRLCSRSSAANASSSRPAIKQLKRA